MTSTSAADINATWEEGDTCLAPSLRDDTLCNAKIQRLIVSSVDNEAMALVVFTSNNDGDEEEEKEETIPVSKLQRPGSNCFMQERPLLLNSLTIPGYSKPLALSQTGSGGEKVPYTINRYLRDYQREGIKFIYGNYKLRRGCILGDDMGLGKTVQVIGFLAAVLHKTGTWQDIENNRPQFLQTQIPLKLNRPNKVFLIVAPLSVLYNWKDELDTWGHFQCVVVHGLRKEEGLDHIRKGRAEIALTTYETLRLCLDNFNSIDWSAVIVDEAHKIKNPNSQITLALKGLKCQVRVGLTGTILQNNIEELWCVMDWALPRCLGSIGHFKNNFSDPIERGQRHNATKRALATGRKTVRVLARKISPWFLRRTKALIKEQLPKKDDRVVYCSLTDFQQMVYQTVLDSEDVTLLLRSSEKCGCESGRTRRSCCYQTNSEGVNMKVLYFSYLAILKKVANHVALLQSTSGTSENQKKYATAICEKVFQKFPDFVLRCKQEAFEALSDPMYSGKMKVLQKLLQHYMQRRDKVLLFSISTKLLDVLESYCMAEGLDYSRLDGTTKSKDRVRIVKEFNSCPHTNLCLVSTMAGGLGLNFVGANVVVLFDPTWNPANDLQAIDRAYRIGQCRDVTVLRLIALGTVEEIIYLRQVYKQQLQCSVMGRENARRYFEAVQGNDGHKGELFGLKNLFRLQTQGTCLTSKILQREGRVEAGVMTTSTHSREEQQQKQEEEEEEEDRRTSDPGYAPLPGHIPVLSAEAAQQTRGMSGVSRGVLDFSSGSENEEEEGLGTRRKKTSDTSVVDVPGSDRLNLLQHGFSKLLQASGARAGSGVGDSSRSGGESGEESSLGEENLGRAGSSGKKEGTSCWVTETSNVTENEADQQARQQKTTNWDSSSGSDLDIETCTREKVFSKRNSNGNSGSNDNPYNSKTEVARVHHFESFSDESEDQNVAMKTFPRIPYRREVDKSKPGSNRKTHRDTSARDQGNGTKHTAEDIDTFTSSDEEHTPKRGKTRGHGSTPQMGRPRVGEQGDGQRGHAKEHQVVEEHHPEKPSVSFTELKMSHFTSSPTAKTAGSIDKILGGVQGVVYTHSNQRVVGGSKAEERISRAALRDVFERKMFSQLPANHLLGTQESLSQSPPGSPPPCTPAVRPNLAVARRLDHPVTFTASTVHHTRINTTIVGQTPQAIRRQQLEDMAAHFKYSSVGQFAEEVLRSTSGQRLALLRQYYTSLNHPELADMVTSLYPNPELAQTEGPAPQHKVGTKRTSQKAGQNFSSHPGTIKPSALQPQKKRRTMNILEPPASIPSAESERQKEDVCDARRHRRTRRASVSKGGGGLGSDRTSSSGLGPGEAVALLDHRDRDGPSSAVPSHGRATAPSKPTAPGSMEHEPKSPLGNNNALGRRGDGPRPPAPPWEPPPPPSPGSLLSDLIGDTSILDDLFRPRASQRRGVPSRVGLTSSTSSTPQTSACPLGVAPSAAPGAKTHMALAPGTSPPAPRPKAGRKDFWDILNEGNEESINRLTDLSEVQRVCVSTSHTARTRGGGEGREGGPLWKTNDKFLWKK